MKQLLLSLILAGSSLAGAAQTIYPRHHVNHSTTAARPVAGPRVYVCGGGSAYAYHNSDNSAGLNRCSHGVSAVTVAEAEGMGRAGKKCY
jgi:hypothetical protein